MFRTMFVLSSIVLTQASDTQICFDEDFGCFDMTSPWKTRLRPIPAPDSPQNISTKLYLFTRNNPYMRETIELRRNMNVSARFEPERPTALICHGFASNGNSSWMDYMKNVYLNRKDANVLLVDWGKGAAGKNYFQVAANTRVVAREISIFLNYLIQKRGAKPEKMHLIGHSLGAQIFGYVGKNVTNIGRITALDPAQPGFEGFDKEVRLHEDDALFVEVIHTNGVPTIPTLGLGMMSAVGDVDFYVNGGLVQPGCVVQTKDIPKISSISDFFKLPVEVLGRSLSCSHSRAHTYYIEALNNTDCKMWGRGATVTSMARAITKTFTQGYFFKTLAGECDEGTCIPLGLDAVESPVKGVVVVTTAKESPYCVTESSSEESKSGAFEG